MTEEKLNHAAMDRALRRETVRHVFTQGNGARLAFLGVLGTGVLFTVLGAPIFAAAFAAACAGLVIPIVRDAFSDRALQRQLLDTVVGDRFPVAAVADPALRQELDKGRRVLVEMAAKQRDTTDATRVGGLDRVVAEAAGLLDLQIESARQAEELERVLGFVDDTGSPRGEGAMSDTERRIRDENIGAIRTEAAAARALVGVITRRLETMLLQSVQVGKDTIDIVRAKEAARDSGETVERLQDIVTARRNAAERLTSMLSPDDETYARSRT
jgi:hypothetical protein